MFMIWVSRDMHVTTLPLWPVLPVKVIIRGERNTGKTALFHRLQGGKFTDAYQPTDEIQACVHVWVWSMCECGPCVGVVHVWEWSMCGAGPCVWGWSMWGVSQLKLMRCALVV